MKKTPRRARLEVGTKEKKEDPRCPSYKSWTQSSAPYSRAAPSCLSPSTAFLSIRRQLRIVMNTLANLLDKSSTNRKKKKKKPLDLTYL